MVNKVAPLKGLFWHEMCEMCEMPASYICLDRLRLLVVTGDVLHLVSSSDLPQEEANALEHRGQEELEKKQKKTRRKVRSECLS